MSYAKEIIILVGPQGVGKSYYCKNTLPNYFRVNQDDQGKKKHREIFAEALGKEDLIVVDRMGFNKEQRARYLVPAKEKGYKTKIIVFTAPFEFLMARLKVRKGHPNLGADTKEETLERALGFYFANFEEPTPDEADVIEHFVAV